MPSQTNKTGTGTLPQFSSEVLPEAPSNALENTGEREKVEKMQDRQEIYRESDQKRVDIDLGRQETDEMAIERLDIAKSIEAQKEEFEVLRSNVRGVLVKLFQRYKPEKINSLDTILTLDTSGIFFHPNEKAALGKLQEIASNPDSELARDYAIQWKTDVKSAFEGYKTAVEIKDDMEQGNEKGRYTSYIREHPYRFAGLVALGAVGAYSIFRWLSKKKEEKKAEEAKTPEKPAEEKKGILGKIWDIGKIFALSVGAVSLGVMLGPESWKEWIKQHVGVNLTREGLRNFWKRIKEGKVEDALDYLHENVEKKVEGIPNKVVEVFSDTKNSLVTFLQGRGFEIPQWLSGANIQEIAKDLGIQPDDHLSWQEFVGVGGGAYLLYKWIGLKGLAANAAIYIFLLKAGQDDGNLRGKIREYSKEVDSVKDRIIQKLVTKYPGIDIFILDIFKDFKFENFLESLLEYASNHKVEALLAFNALWICRGIILTTLLTLPRKAAGFAWDHPIAATGGAATVAALYVGRRKFIEDFVEAVYEGETQPENIKAKEDLQKMLDATFGVDREKSAGLPETQMPLLLKELIADPAKTLVSADFKEAFQKGWVHLGLTAAGRVFATMKEFAAPILLPQLTVDALSSTYDYLFSEQDNPEGLMWKPVLVGGVEAYVFGKMTLGSWRAMGDVMSVVGDGIVDKTGKVIKSLFWLPSKEFRHVWRSAVWSAPGGKTLLTSFRAGKIARTQNDISEILAEMRKKSPDYTKIEKLAGDAKKRLNLHRLKEEDELLKRNPLYMKLRKAFGDLEPKFAGLESCVNDVRVNAALARDEENILKIKRNIQNINDDLLALDSFMLNLQRRGIYIWQGKFREAMDLRLDHERDITPPAEKLRAEDVFETSGTAKTTAQLQSDLAKLNTDIGAMPDTNPQKVTLIKERNALEAYLNSSVKSSYVFESSALVGLKNPEKAVKLEHMAARLEGIERGVQREFQQRLNTIVEDARTRGISLTDPSITSQLDQLDRDIVVPFARQKSTYLSELNTEYERLDPRMRTRSLKSQMRLAVEGAEGSYLTRVTKGIKGRVKLMAVSTALMFATDAIIEGATTDKEFVEIMSEIADSKEMKQLLFDVLPLTGTYSNFYSAFTGKEIISERDVSGTWDRVSNVIWGTVGVAGDAITVLSFIPSGATSLGGNAIFRLVKASRAGDRTARRLLQLWPRIERVAERCGGWYEFAKRAGKYLNSDSSKALQSLHKIEKAGVVVGTTMLASGVAANLYYGFVGEDFALPSDIASAEDVAPEAEDNREVPEAA